MEALFANRRKPPATGAGPASRSGYRENQLQRIVHERLDPAAPIRTSPRSRGCSAGLPMDSINQARVRWSLSARNSSGRSARPSVSSIDSPIFWEKHRALPYLSSRGGRKILMATEHTPISASVSPEIKARLERFAPSRGRASECQRPEFPEARASERGPNATPPESRSGSRGHRVDTWSGRRSARCRRD